MNARILDGTLIRNQILAELKPRIEALAAKHRPPGLAVVLVGHNPASEIYVRSKVKTCSDIGIYSETLTPPDSISTDELLAIVRELNRRGEIDGILVQMPLPRQVDSHAILLAISPDKDVDGFHPCNVGRLVAGTPGPRPCTPAGIMEMLKRYEISIAGKRAVVIGRSDIVGKPMALLLLHQNATVTICHSKTRHLAEECRRADILVAAIGRPAFVTKNFIREGATVVDVGMNRITDRAEAERIFAELPAKMAEFERKGNALIGDAHPFDVRQAGAYTPVPGGVGPLTIAMLMSNTVDAAEHRLCSESA